MKGLQYVIDLIDKGFGAGIKKAKQQTKGLDDAVNGTNDSLKKIKTTGQQSFNGIDKAINKTDRNFKKIQSTGQKSFSSIGKYARRAGMAVVAALSIGAAINFGNELTKVSAQFEGMENAIHFASGKEGGKNIQFLDDTINKLNLDMTSSYKGFQTLTGSLKGTSLEGQATRDIFEAVGVASTVMNLSAEQSEGAFLALSQMASKGKVQAEELRGQLGERIPGALKIAADSMGMSQQQFNKMLDSGKVYAEDFLPKFAKQLKSTFEDGLPKAANSMQAAINRKNNALLSFKRVSAEAFRPLFIEVLEGGSQLFGFLSDMMKHLDPVKKALKEVGQAFSPLTQAIGNMFAPLSQFSESGNMAESVMNGIGSAIQSVMPFFEFLGSTLGFIFENVSRVTSALYNTISGLFEAGTAGEYLNNILGIAQWLWQALSPAVSAFTDVLVFGIGVVGEITGTIMETVNALAEWGKKTEWVQRLLNSFLGAFSSTFTTIKNIATNVLGGVGDLLVGIFTLDMERIKSALSKGFDAIGEGFKSIPNAVGGAIDGWNKDLEAPISKNVKVNQQVTQKNTDNGLLTNDTTQSKPTAPSAVPNKNVPAQTVAGTSNSGGTKHTTIHIESFVKELKVQTQNLKESPREIKKMVERIMNEAFADIQVRLDNA